MKKLLIYIFCLALLLGCKKSERLQKDETIVSGTVTEKQRGIPIERITVKLYETEEAGEKNWQCKEQCTRIIDSTTTDANGHYEFKFKAKTGSYWNYMCCARDKNYIVNATTNNCTKIPADLLLKAKTNTVNLELIATGTFKLVAIQSVADTNFYISSFGLNSLGSDNQQVIFTPVNYPKKAVLITTRVEAGINYTLDFRINKITNFQTGSIVLYSKKLIDYYLTPEQNITDTLYF